MGVKSPRPLPVVYAVGGALSYAGLSFLLVLGFAKNEQMIQSQLKTSMVLDDKLMSQKQRGRFGGRIIMMLFHGHAICETQEAKARYYDIHHRRRNREDYSALRTQQAVTIQRQLSFVLNVFESGQ